MVRLSVRAGSNSSLSSTRTSWSSSTRRARTRRWHDCAASASRSALPRCHPARPLADDDPDRRPARRQDDGAHAAQRSHGSYGLPGLRRAGPGRGPRSRRDRHHRRPAGAQGRRRPPGHRGRGRGTALAAALLARSRPDREGVVQAEVDPARRCFANHRQPLDGSRSRAPAVQRPRVQKLPRRRRRPLYLIGRALEGVMYYDAAWA